MATADNRRIFGCRIKLKIIVKQQYCGKNNLNSFIKTYASYRFIDEL